MMRNQKTLKMPNKAILSIGLAGLLVVVASACDKLPVILDHNARLKPIPATDRMVGEQTPIPDEYFDAISATNTTLEQAVNSMQLPAVSIAVGLDGELIWARALGVRDLENGMPVSLDTKFRIGSTAKAVTGTIAARLVEEDVLDLEASISDLVPYYPEKQYDVTVRQLLTHTAGIRAYEGNEYYSKKTHENVQSAVSEFANSPLLFEPGTNFSYTTYGYVLASAAMEGASGMSFDELIQGTLTEPLGMQNTMREGLAIGDFATPYEIRKGKYKTPFPADNSNRTAGGGFVATPTDLIAMTQEIMTGDYLSSETKNALFYTPQTLANGEMNEQAYAIGWRYHIWQSIFNGERDIFIAHHYGKASGGESFLLMLPEHKLSISIITNRNIEDISTFRQLIIPLTEGLILHTENIE